MILRMLQPELYPGYLKRASNTQVLCNRLLLNHREAAALHEHHHAEPD